MAQQHPDQFRRAGHDACTADLALHVLFATRVLGMSPGVMGVAQMVGGLGVLASAMIVKPLSERYGAGATIVIGLCASALGFGLLPAIPPALFGSPAATAAAFAIVALALAVTTVFGTRLRAVRD